MLFQQGPSPREALLPIWVVAAEARLEWQNDGAQCLPATGARYCPPLLQRNHIYRLMLQLWVINRTRAALNKRLDQALLGGWDLGEVF